MMIERRPVSWHWRRMPAATLGAGAGIVPVKDQWYTVLDTIRNARIKSITIKQSNDEAAVKNLNMRITTGKETLTRPSGVLCNSGSLNYAEIYRGTPFISIGTSITLLGMYAAFTFDSVKVEVKNESAVGTNPLLFSTVQYERLWRVVK